MQKTAALARSVQPDALTLGVLRFMLVSGCATALLLARYPLPF